MILPYKSELLKYRISRRKNNFNKKELYFFKINNLIYQKMRLVNKSNNEEGD